MKSSNPTPQNPGHISLHQTRYLTLADELYRSRTADGWAWLRLPTVRLGLTAAVAFASRHNRGVPIAGMRIAFYRCETGLFAAKAGDFDTAELHLHKALRYYSDWYPTRISLWTDTD